MKYLSHIALPLLMFGLLALAFILPKFVQEAAPEGATDPFGVQSKKVQPESKPFEFSSPKAKQPVTKVPVAEKGSKPKVAAVDSREKKSNFTNSLDDLDGLITPFMAHLKSGEFDKADKMLTTLKPEVSPIIHSSLQYSLNSSREVIKAKEEARVERALRKNELARAHDELKATHEFVQETMKSSNASVPQVTDSPKPAPVENEPEIVDVASAEAWIAKIEGKETTIELPEGTSVNFGFNSSDVPYQAKAPLDRIAELLRNESKLGIQLRGYSDSVGNAQYNAILSKTRSQRIQQNLIGKGVAENQIDIVPFGSSVSPRGRSAAHRRVDLVFFELEETR